ncbi:MAG: hypothetical protein WC865_04380 [Bacteroidales bacterium]
MSPHRTFKIGFRRIFLSISLICTGLAGFSQWSNDPKTNLIISGSSTYNFSPAISATSTGGSFITWYPRYKGDPSASFKICYLDARGNFVWFPELLTIRPPVENLGMVYYRLTTDHSDNALVGFMDSRLDQTDITVTKISTSGQFLWGLVGHTFDLPNSFEAFPEIAVAQDNSVFVVFTSSISPPGGWQVYSLILQKLDPDGNEVWGYGGTRISDPVKSLEQPNVIPYPDGGCAVIYYTIEVVTDDVVIRQLFINRFDKMGKAVWAQPTMLINAERFGLVPAFTARMGKDNLIYIAWSSYKSIYLQCVHPDGRKAFKDTGLELCEQYPGITDQPMTGGEDSNGNIYIFWAGLNSYNTEVYLKGQAISDQGELLWGPDGKKIISSCSLVRMNTKIYNDTLYVQYCINSSNVTYYKKILINQFNLDGQPLSQPAVINDVSSWKGDVDQSDFVNNQTVFVWEDGENPNVIKVQNYYTSGSIGPSATRNITTIDQSPNYFFDPSSNTFTVTGSNELLNLILYNSLGIKIFETSFSTKYTIPALPTGLYIFTVQTLHSEILLKGKLML